MPTLIFKRDKALGSVRDHQIFSRTIIEQCRPHEKLHVHYEIARDDWFKNGVPQVQGHEGQPLPADLGDARQEASVQFTFAIPLPELPIGSLIKPMIQFYNGPSFDSSQEASGIPQIASLRSGEFQMNHPNVKKIEFRILSSGVINILMKGVINILMKGVAEVSLGDDAMTEAFHQFYPVFERSILARAEPRSLSST